MGGRLTNPDTIAGIGSLDDEVSQALEQHVVRTDERLGKQSGGLRVQDGLLAVRGRQRLIEHQQAAKEHEKDGADEA